MLSDVPESAALTIDVPLAVRAGLGTTVALRGRQAWDMVLARRTELASIAAQFGVFGLTAFQGFLLARLLEPVGRGEYATAVFYSYTLPYIGFLGGLVSIVRHGLRNERPIEELRSSALKLGLMVGIGTSLTAATLALIGLPEGKRYLIPLCVLCSFTLPFEQMRLALLCVDQGSSSFKRYNINRLLAALALPLLLVVAWYSGVVSVTTAAVLTVLANVVSLGVHLYSVGGFSGFAKSKLSPRTLLKEGLPFAPGLIAGNLFPRIDVFLMLWLADIRVQGLYAAAVPAAGLLIVAATALELFAFNAGARSTELASPKRLAGAALSVAGLQLVTLVAFAVVLEPLMVLVFGPSFRAAVPLALALLPAYALCGCEMVAEGYLRGRGKTAISVWPRVLGAGVMLAVVLFGFDRWGPISIPWGATAGQATVLLCMGAAIWGDVQNHRRTNLAKSDTLMREVLG